MLSILSNILSLSNIDEPTADVFNINAGCLGLFLKYSKKDLIK